MTEHQPGYHGRPGLREPPPDPPPSVFGRIATDLARASRRVDSAAREARTILGLDRQKSVEPPPRKHTPSIYTFIH